MKLTFSGGLFVTEGSLRGGERERLEHVGFTWDEVGKRFTTSSPAVATRLRFFCDDIAKNQLNLESFQLEPWPGRLRWPKGLTPDAHQLEMARFSLSRNNSYLAADPGTGKTPSAALVLNADPTSVAVYICPPGQIFNVAYEMQTWAPKRPVTILGHSREPLDIVPPSGILIVKDSLTGRAPVREVINTWRVKALQRGVRPTIITDEAHRIKNDKAKRTKAAFDLMTGFTRKIFMSGSLMPNRPMEIYGVAKFAAANLLGKYVNRFQFGMRYCDGVHNGFGWDFSGASHVPELFERLSPFILRVRDDVLGLDEPREQVCIVGDEVPLELRELNSRLIRKHSPEDSMNPFEEHASTYRRKVGEAKVKDAIPLIVEKLEDLGDGEALILFYHHRSVGAHLGAAFKRYQPMTITADDPTPIRKKIELEFQKDKSCKLMIASLTAANLGFNLTRANHVDILEPSWVDEDNRQAFKRAHRRGQTKPVYVRYFVYKNSIDRIIMETALRKRRLNNLIQTKSKGIAMQLVIEGKTVAELQKNVAAVNAEWSALQVGKTAKQKKAAAAADEEETYGEEEAEETEAEETEEESEPDTEEEAEEAEEYEAEETEEESEPDTTIDDLQKVIKLHSKKTGDSAKSIALLKKWAGVSEAKKVPAKKLSAVYDQFTSALKKLK